MNDKLKPIALGVGAAFAASVASLALANAEADLFAAEELTESQVLLADNHGGDGDGDGDGDDGDGDGDGSCGEDGSCGGDDKGDGAYDILAQADDDSDDDDDDDGEDDGEDGEDGDDDGEDGDGDA